MSRWDPFEDDDPLMGVLSKKALKEGIPISGLITLTTHCNLKCIHCYATPVCKQYQKELDTNEFKRVFDEIADMGTLYLVFTGGEPMLRPDFKELYTYARKLGFLLTLFSNATLVNNEIVALLKDLPPRYVDISIYGATEATYESITGIKGSYRHCIEGIELLLKNDIKVRLKTVLMKPNIAEFAELKKLAESYDLPYRIDSAVTGRFCGDKSPLDLRISPEQGVECESQMDRFKEDVERLLNLSSDSFVSEKLYNCGAGRSTFSVTETGMLRPCLMVTGIEADLKQYSFKEAWTQIRKTIFSLKAPKDNKCDECDMHNLCGYCPPMGEYSSYGYDDTKEYFCEVGRARRALMEKYKSNFTVDSL